MPRKSRALPLPLPAADLHRLRARVRALAENRPGTYRMVDVLGRVLYVGKAKALRTRLLSYFRAEYPDKAARILNAAHDIRFEYASSEFAAHLQELRLIRRHRPPFNYHMNHGRRGVLVKLSRGDAPRFTVGAQIQPEDIRAWGPFRSLGRAFDAVRTLNDLLGLRDCSAAMPMVFAEQTDLFATPMRAACPRFDFGFCSAPCAAMIAQRDYASRVQQAVAFLEGTALAPLDRAIREMADAAASAEFERATHWRDRFEHLEWLLSATTRARVSRELLTFVYRDRSDHGDDRAYVIRHGLVRAEAAWPETPIEREAFAAVVRRETEEAAGPLGPLPLEAVDEVMLLMSWFRRRPEALRRTVGLADWP